MQEIKSAESAVLTSPGLASYREALQNARHQYMETERELERARPAAERATAHYQRWRDGWLLKRLMKKRYAVLELSASDAVALKDELEEQLQLSKLPTQFEMSDGIALAFSNLREAFERVSRSQRVWDNVAHRQANRVAERTTASRIVDLKPVRFRPDQCETIEAAMTVPRLQNANGGDLYLYPAFLLYAVSATNYALIEYRDVQLSMTHAHFHEEGAVPSDAVQIGTTWAKANKDGSPDRRFKDNHQIPVMRYARLVLQTRAGLNEEYMVSNVEAAEAFKDAWDALVLASGEPAAMPGAR